MDAAEIRACLNELAPLRPGNVVNAESLARYFAMEAQVIWARWAMDDPGKADGRDIATLSGYFAAAHALLTLHRCAPATGGEVAKQIVNALQNPNSTGPWIRELNGSNAAMIAGFAAALAEVTEAGPDGHVRETSPAPVTDELPFPAGDAAPEPSLD